MTTAELKNKGKGKAPTGHGTFPEWVESGPFRKWRTAQELSQHRAAMRCGVVLGTIQSWERGAWLPAEDKFKDLADIMRDPQLKAKWIAWYQKGRSIESKAEFSS